MQKNKQISICAKEVSQPIPCLPLYRLCLLGPPLKNLSVHYKKPLFASSLPMLPLAAFLSHPPPTSPLWRGRSSCRVITGCLSSTPIFLLHIEALLPPLRVTLTHQFLSYFEGALRLLHPFLSLSHSS